MSLFFKILDHNLYRTIELFFLSAIIPVLVLFFKFYNLVIPVLWLVSIYCLSIYILGKNSIKINFKNLFNFRFTTLLKIIIRWFIISIFIYLITYYFFYDKLFIIQNNKPEILWKIMVLYPIFSALPQEFIFCKYFFYRYKNIFKNEKYLIIFSAIFFSIAHILFLNYIAPILSLIGGIIFASTYLKHKSLLLVSLEHGLYGNTLFFFGLGWYFWGGSIS